MQHPALELESIGGISREQNKHHEVVTSGHSATFRLAPHNLRLADRVFHSIYSALPSILRYKLSSIPIAKVAKISNQGAIPISRTEACQGAFKVVRALRRVKVPTILLRIFDPSTRTGTSPLFLRWTFQKQAQLGSLAGLTLCHCGFLDNQKKPISHYLEARLVLLKFIYTSK